MARPFPQDQVEHELRSLRHHLRSFDHLCPTVVRIKAREGTFVRPSIDLAVVTSSPIDDERYGLTTRRSIALLWWGTEDEANGESEAHQAADWLTKAIVKGGIDRMSTIPIYDWSGDQPAAVLHYMDIDAESVDARPVPDEYGFWMVALDFRYTSRVDWPLEPFPRITTVKGIVPAPSAPMKITIP